MPNTIKFIGFKIDLIFDGNNKLKDIADRLKLLKPIEMTTLASGDENTVNGQRDPLILALYQEYLNFLSYMRKFYAGRQ